MTIDQFNFAGKKAFVRVDFNVPPVSYTHLDVYKRQLLINAIKYSNEGGEINIITSLSEKKDRVRISVSDQGPGLKDIDVSKLFTRFYQGENSRPSSGTLRVPRKRSTSS